MRSRPTRIFLPALALVISLLLIACSRKPAPAATGTPSSSPSLAVTTTASATASVTAGASASATATGTATASAVACIATPGSSIQIGSATVVVDCFRAQVSDPAGVNIRSSPAVTADNRTGSLPTGATVDVQGRVLQGQEAEPGNGTLWYYVGSAGTTPQFIYGATGTLTPLNAAATPVPPTGSATPVAGATGTPAPPTGSVTPAASATGTPAASATAAPPNAGSPSATPLATP